MTSQWIGKWRTPAAVKHLDMLEDCSRQYWLQPKLISKMGGDGLRGKDMLQTVLHDTKRMWVCKIFEMIHMKVNGGDFLKKKVLLIQHHVTSETFGVTFAFHSRCTMLYTKMQGK
jgi:hypothetical protein